MRIQDYVLILLMEELSESIKACSKIIRYGSNEFLTKERDMTTENLLAHEIMDTIATLILLQELGINIMPTAIEFLLNQSEVLNELEYRFKSIFKFTRNSNYLELDMEEWGVLEDTIMAKIDECKKKAKLKSDKKNYDAIVGQYQK